ncbi:phage portal protein [Paenibacillus sp. HN-1]|uniref:phage portal protein n=1 Tax=Paenibacillus TaxID=44249 RepID=UPI001CAA35C7|nr:MULTISPECIES: phage portal protein [Paenibacillus]MBY9081006.1 phage portal protein [Paenibacillus sp. CGMCC 1.18879]MBY9084108.1 phage portal protein [Paenibacillus sinensis]
MAKWLDKAVGEISKLRQGIAGLFGTITGVLGGTYHLDSSRVDYQKARELYDNTLDSYKLGAGFAKKVVNATVGFIGLPEFKSEDEDAATLLNDFLKANESKAQQTHLNAIKEGDCYVWLTREKNDSPLYKDEETRIMYNIIPPEQVKREERDPLTGEINRYVLESDHTWYDDSGAERKCKIKQLLTAEERTIQVEGDRPPGLEDETIPNKWGFIPIVHFRNDVDETAQYGKSELESIEPFLKVYHDLMLASIQGSKMHSTPRLKITVKDVGAFLRNNFAVSDTADFQRKGGRIDLHGKEILIFQDGEDAEFIEAKSATGDNTALLEFVFYCIVSASETPEFIFGVHTPSSLSSVQEQMPIFIQKVERKRKGFSDSWTLLARMVLAMTAGAENKSFSTFETKLVWETVDQRDSKDVAEELKLTVEALDKALSAQLISHEAAVQYLKYWVDTMHDYETKGGIEGEKERIINWNILRERLEGGDLQQEAS